jgi:Phosphoribosyl transferase domain
VNFGASVCSRQLRLPTCTEHATHRSNQPLFSHRQAIVARVVEAGSYVPNAQVICTKVRDGAKRIVRLKEGEPRGKHVVIVDDLVQSGGTLIECQKLLAAQVRWLHAGRCAPYSCITPDSASHSYRKTGDQQTDAHCAHAAGCRQRQRVCDTRRVPQRHIRALQPTRQWVLCRWVQVLLDHRFVRQYSPCTSRPTAIRGECLQLGLAFSPLCYDNCIAAESTET